VPATSYLASKHFQSPVLLSVNSLDVKFVCLEDKESNIFTSNVPGKLQMTMPFSIHEGKKHLEAQGQDHPTSQ
jgi:hypothetical protein